MIDDALTRIYALSKTGATVVCGVFESSEDPLEAALDALYTVRSGGAALTIDETRARLEEAGFRDVREVERTWHAPVQLVVGTR